MKKVPAPNGIDVENISTEPSLVEVITRYEKGEEPTYSVDGGETFVTRDKFQPTNQKEEL